MDADLQEGRTLPLPRGPLAEHLQAMHAIVEHLAFANPVPGVRNAVAAHGHHVQAVAAFTADRLSPDPRHPAGPEDGHTFRILYDCRGSGAVTGDPAYTDDPEFSGILHAVEVRAWDLRTALRAAAALPFGDLMGEDSALPPRPTLAEDEDGYPATPPGWASVLCGIDPAAGPDSRPVVLCGWTDAGLFVQYAPTEAIVTVAVEALQEAHRG